MAQEENSSRAEIDWEKIEPHWRAGIRTKLEISNEFGVSRAAMDKHFKKLGIERDLTAKIQAKAESLVAQAQVTKLVTQERLRVTETDVVDANAEVQADAQIKQRRNTSRAIEVVEKLFAGLEGQVDLRNDLESLGDLMRSSDDTDRLNDIYRKVISFPSNVDSAKKLMEALRIGIELQRKVLRIRDEDTVPTDGIAALLRGMAKSAIKPVALTDDDD